MLSVSKPINPATARSYYEKDDYYLREGGSWWGEGAEALGLSGPIKEREPYYRVVDGRHPVTGEELIPHVHRAHDLEHRAGYDLTFNAPKSVSLLALADPRIQAVHDRAVTCALRYVESHYALTRTGAGGVTTVETGNLLVARFDHLASRELDPHLHTHCLLANMTLAPDGKWRSLEPLRIYQEQLFVGQVYRNELARELRALRYALTVSDRQKGLFEITGPAAEVLEHFSKRRAQIEAEVARLRQAGLYPEATQAQLFEIAALGSRREKQAIKREELAARWRDELGALGTSPEDLLARAQAAAREPRDEPPALTALDYVRLGAAAVTEREAVFEREDVLRAALRLAIGRATVGDLESAFTALAEARSSELLPLAGGQWTTREMYDIERQILALTRSHTSGAAVQQGVARAALAPRRLTEGQRAAAQLIATSPRGVLLVQGDAGTGKTTMLAAARDLLGQDGYELRGFAYTGRAAAELADKGVPAQTLHSFLATPAGEFLPGCPEVWVLDEASMVGSRQLRDLLARACRARAKLVLVGDQKQLAALSAGRMFGVLQEKTAAPLAEMHEVLRQESEYLRDAVAALGRGAIPEAFSALTQGGAVSPATVIEDRNARLAAVAASYLEHRAAGGPTAIVTSRNADRVDLNARVRAALLGRGELGADPTRVEVLVPVGLDATAARFADSYRVGQVVALEGPVPAAGKAGTLWTVQAVDPTRNVVVLETTGRRGERRSVAVDVTAEGQKLSVWAPVPREFRVGDRVVFTRNNRRFGLANGLTGTVERMGTAGDLSIRADDGRLIPLNVAERGARRYRFVDHGYAVTVHKAQGATVGTVIWHADASRAFDHENTRNACYVALTRGTHEARIFTQDLARLMHQVARSEDKTSTFDHPVASSRRRRTRNPGGDSVMCAAQENPYTARYDCESGRITLRGPGALRQFSGDEAQALARQLGTVTPRERPEVLRRWLEEGPQSDPGRPITQPAPEVEPDPSARELREGAEITSPPPPARCPAERPPRFAVGRYRMGDRLALEGPLAQAERSYLERCVKYEDLQGLRTVTEFLRQTRPLRVAELDHPTCESWAASKPPLDRTAEAVRRQLEAFGVDRFDIGLHHAETDAFNGRSTQNLTKDEVLKRLDYFKYRNATGWNVYIRPAGDRHEWTLVDDLTRDQLRLMDRQGFTPAIVVETSSGNYHAWVRHDRALDPEPRREAARALAARFHGDPGSTDRAHYGRLAGFTNRKVEHRHADGLYPFVRLRRSASTVYPKARDFLDGLAQVRTGKAEERPPSPRRVPAIAARAVSNRGRSVRSLEDFQRDAKYAGDLHRADFGWALHAAHRGYSEDEIAGAIAGARDLAKKGSEHRQDDYARRTAAKAVAQVSRSGPAPAVER